MKKKYYLLSAAGVLIAVLSFGLGYTYAYIQGLIRTWDMVVGTHSSILLATSNTLTQRLKSPDTTELIEATQENGDSLARFIVDFKPVMKNSETRKHIEIALTDWEQAKERLRELRTLQTEDTNDSPASGI